MMDTRSFGKTLTQISWGTSPRKHTGMNTTSCRWKSLVSTISWTITGLTCTGQTGIWNRADIRLQFSIGTACLGHITTTITTTTIIITTIITTQTTAIMYKTTIPVIILMGSSRSLLHVILLSKTTTCWSNKASPRPWPSRNWWDFKKSMTNMYNWFCKKKRPCSNITKNI